MAHIDTHMGWATGVLAAAGLAASLVPQHARACSWDCSPGYFLPASGSTIPENAPALLWRAGKGEEAADGGSAQIRLERTDLEDGSAGVAFHVVEHEWGTWLELDEALVEGARYRLSEEGECAAKAVEFNVGEPAPLPATLGGLKLAAVRPEPVHVATSSGSCSTSVAAVATLTASALSSEARPWSALLSFQALVDGEPFLPRRSIVPTPPPAGDQVRLYAECPELYPSDMERDDHADSDQGLAQGQHSVTLEARLPGVDDVLSTPAQRLTLECPRRGAIEGAGVPKDGGSAGAPSDPAEPETGEGGSDCSLHPARSGALSHELLALLALLVGRAWLRRRRPE